MIFSDSILGKICKNVIEFNKFTLFYSNILSRLTFMSFNSILPFFGAGKLTKELKIWQFFSK